MESSSVCEDPRAFGEMLGRRLDEVIERWTQRVRGDPDVPQARRLSAPALRDHMPQFLMHVAESLFEQKDQRRSGERNGKEVGQAEESRAHARDRWSVGYALPEAVRELSHMRAVLMELCGTGDTALGGEGAKLLHVALDEAMASVAVEMAKHEIAAISQAKDEAVRVRALYETILEAQSAVGEGVAIAEANGRIAFANDAYAVLTGCSRAGLPTMDIFAMIVPEMRDEVRRQFAKCAKTSGGSSEHRTRYLRADGSEIEVDVHFRSTPDAPPRVVIIARDITARARAEELLRRSEERFRRIADSGMVGIFFWSADGRIFDPNDAFLAMLGTAAQDAGKLRWDEITPPEYGELDRRSMETLKRDGAVMPFEKEFIRADGSRIAVIVAAAKLPGDALSGVAIVLDVSDRKRADEFRERVIGIVGHDLRNPLMSIGIAAKLLQRAPNPDPQSVRLVSRIMSSAEKMERLIRSTLEYTRARVGGGIIAHPKETRLSALVERATMEAEALHPDRPVSVRGNGDDRVQWDEERIEQALSNLLSNALRYGTGSPEIAWSAEQDRLEIRVHNDGPPIPADRIAHIFDPFERASTMRDGLGLGLYIVKNVVEAHGGTIAVSSTAKQGTMFTLSMPRDVPEG